MTNEEWLTVPKSDLLLSIIVVALQSEDRIEKREKLDLKATPEIHENKLK